MGNRSLTVTPVGSVIGEVYFPDALEAADTHSGEKPQKCPFLGLFGPKGVVNSMPIRLINALGIGTHKVCSLF